MNIKEGISLQDKFIIKINNFKDNDTPLIYKLSLYLS